MTWWTLTITVYIPLQLRQGERDSKGDALSLSLSPCPPRILAIVSKNGASQLCGPEYHRVIGLMGEFVYVDSRTGCKGSNLSSLLLLAIV